jgi:tRNA threonylcarbamoyladenosine biosynthesis protein TsaE
MSPILDAHSIECPSHSPEQTRRLGVRLGELLRAGDLVCLEGALGTGKTCLAQGIGRGCGVTESLISPTFTLIHEYQRSHNGRALYHVDLYRIANVQEALGLGLDDYLDDRSAITVIEWPERAGELLPDDRLWILIRRIKGNRRILLLSAHGARYEALLREFRKRAFGV